MKVAQQSAQMSESERKAFAQRLGEFRGTLAPAERRILDAMVMAAEARDDVQGYEWFYGGSTASPQYYLGNILPPTQASWWSIYSDNSSWYNNRFTP
jgi:hypothetical protein